MSDQLPVAFSVFAATLRPQVVKRDKTGRPAQMVPGAVDEVWLKYIKSQHGKEKHSLQAWAALIDKYRHLPAYEGI